MQGIRTMNCGVLNSHKHHLFVKLKYSMLFYKRQCWSEHYLSTATDRTRLWCGRGLDQRRSSSRHLNTPLAARGERRARRATPTSCRRRGTLAIPHCPQRRGLCQFRSLLFYNSLQSCLHFILLLRLQDRPFQIFKALYVTKSLLFFEIQSHQTKSGKYLDNFRYLYKFVLTKWQRIKELEYISK